MIQLSPLASPSKSLFWTAAVADSSELSTDDPLGLEYIAQQVGLMLLPTFTTRSSRAQAYAMVLYGLSLAERAIAEYELPRTDESRRVLFERWERFWALATIESVGGNLPRGSWNTMRGVRGAKAAWFAGTSPLPIDFPLISRQQELGNLGAYLAPLRRASLIGAGGLSPLPLAIEVVGAFWGDPGMRKLTACDELALHILDPKVTKVARAEGSLSLKLVGERSRLDSIWNREDQRTRLHHLLFVSAKDDTTLAVSQIVEQATKGEILASRDIVEAALASRFGALSDRLRALFSTALLYGDFMAELTAAFDRAYRALMNAGFAADHSTIAEATFDADLLGRLKHAGAALLEAPCAKEIQGLPAHGRGCMRLAGDLQEASAVTALEQILAYHHKVQRERRRGTGWISTQDGKLMLMVTTYTARPGTLRFPSYKLDTVRTLLTDLGRVPRAQELPEVAA